MSITWIYANPSPSNVEYSNDKRVLEHVNVASEFIKYKNISLSTYITLLLLLPQTHLNIVEQLELITSRLNWVKSRHNQITG